jgi:hypothetical protein
MTVIAPLDSRLSILNPIDYFSTHLYTGKRESYDYTFALIISFLVHHLCACSPSSLSSCTCDLMAIIIMLLAPSSHVLLCLTQFTWHNDINNLMSLITKTKLGLSRCSYANKWDILRLLMAIHVLLLHCLLLIRRQIRLIREPCRFDPESRSKNLNDIIYESNILFVEQLRMDILAYTRKVAPWGQIINGLKRR